MTLGPVRVMAAGVVVIMFVEEVSLACGYLRNNLNNVWSTIPVVLVGTIDK